MLIVKEATLWNTKIKTFCTHTMVIVIDISSEAVFLVVCDPSINEL
jgi:hypothetical protein